MSPITVEALSLPKVSSPTISVSHDTAENQRWEGKASQEADVDGREVSQQAQALPTEGSAPCPWRPSQLPRPQIKCSR